MKLLLFSDLHLDLNAARSIATRSRNFDVIIGAGDFAQARRGLIECLAPLRAIEKPLVLVPGNNEWEDELRAACVSWPQATVLHGAGTTINGVEFFGLGGGVPPTPFGDWSFDLSEAEATQLLEDCPHGAVLISHSPPRGALDVSSSGQSLGSESVRRTIDAKRPALVVCGHIHASGGRSTWLDETAVVNAGPGGMEWELSR
jgi:Icc-related predicted phosphoesterase